jgi:hypothetical protein
LWAQACKCVWIDFFVLGRTICQIRPP